MRKYREGAKSELEQQRELLDSLMGMNRNNDRGVDQVRDFRDERVCKFFLTGMCPHDIFVNTKMDEGPCPKIHSEIYKTEFERNGDLFMYDHALEREFVNRIAEADRIIKKARMRVEDDKIDESLNPDVNPDVLRIHAEMSKVIQEAEAAAEEGSFDRVQDLMLGRFEDLTKEKANVLARINDQLKQSAGATDKKLRVCDVCGSFLSIFDSDKRLTDHFMGKQHVGFQYMRDALQTIYKRREERKTKEREQRSSSVPGTTDGSNGHGHARRDASRERERGEIVDSRSASRGGGLEQGHRGDRGWDRERERDSGSRYQDNRHRDQQNYRRRDDHAYDSRYRGGAHQGGGHRSGGPSRRSRSRS